MKIVWRVAEVPSGQYRAFVKRGWPVAYFNSEDGPRAAVIMCEDEYVPAKVKTGDHAPLRISIDDYSGDKRKMRLLKKKAATLAEAKKLVKAFYDAKPQCLPGE